jgi:hypothetical protein
VGLREILGSIQFERPDCFLPISAIEFSDFEMGRFQVEIVEATYIDAVHVGSRPRIAKWVDATIFAEPMFRDPGVKLIERKRLGPGQQLELLRRHPMKKRAFFGADGAITLNRNLEVSHDFEFYSPAVATAVVGFHMNSHWLVEYRFQARMPGPRWGKTGGDQNWRSTARISMRSSSLPSFS